jgi:aminoglycoside/choline kinase family phosphotransferase
VLGIFCRLHYRDGKSHYLSDLPRFVGYIRKTAGRYEELESLLPILAGQEKNPEEKIPMSIFPVKRSLA